MELCKYQLVYEIRFHSGVTKLYCSFALPFLSRVFLYFYGLYPAPTSVLSRFVFSSYRENRVPTKPVHIARNKTSKTKQSVKWKLPFPWTFQFRNAPLARSTGFINFANFQSLYYISSPSKTSAECKTKVVISTNVSISKFTLLSRSIGFINFANFQRFLYYIFSSLKINHRLLHYYITVDWCSPLETYFLPIVIDSAPRLAVLESGRGQSNAGTLLDRFQKTAISPNDRTPSRSVKQISPVRYVSVISCISMHRRIVIPRVIQDGFIDGNLFSIYHAHDPLVRQPSDEFVEKYFATGELSF